MKRNIRTREMHDLLWHIATSLVPIKRTTKKGSLLTQAMRHNSTAKLRLIAKYGKGSKQGKAAHTVLVERRRAR